MHKKTLGCYTDLSLQNCHFESKTAAPYYGYIVSICSPSNYSISERWSPCNVACRLKKKTIASEWNISECNILSRTWSISVLCNIHLLNTVPTEDDPNCFTKTGLFEHQHSMLWTSSRRHPSCLLMKQPARKKHVRHIWNKPFTSIH